MAGSKDFNIDKVPKGVSDPKGFHLNGEFPRHLHKFDNGDDGEILGEYTGGPTRRFVVARSVEDVEAFLSKGWLMAAPPKPNQPAKPADATQPAKR